MNNPRVFSIDGIHCGSCVARITEAVKAVDPGAALRIDLAGHRVEIDPTVADAAALSDAIREAGFTPVA